MAEQVVEAYRRKGRWLEVIYTPTDPDNYAHLILKWDFPDKDRTHEQIYHYSGLYAYNCRACHKGDFTDFTVSFVRRRTLSWIKRLFGVKPKSPQERINALICKGVDELERVWADHMQEHETNSKHIAEISALSEGFKRAFQDLDSYNQNSTGSGAVLHPNTTKKTLSQ